MIETTYNVRCENDNRTYKAKAGSSLSDLLEIFGTKRKYPFIGACVNNKYKDLNFCVFNNMTVRFKSLQFVNIAAAFMS